MDTRTGEILDEVQVDKLKKELEGIPEKKYTMNFVVPFPRSLLSQIDGMNREARRKWMRENKALVKSELAKEETERTLPANSDKEATDEA